MATDDARQPGTGLTPGTGARHARAFAHRPFILKLADRIVVLEHGRVAETGVYAPVLAAGGTLAELLAGAAYDPL